MANEITEIERSYIDNYAIKEFVKDALVPKYFPDIDVSLRTVGTIGLISEWISNISEDSFNATSVLFREAFPNRAEIPESIYSHASIFQLSNIFSKASACSFLIVLEEESIINNMIYDTSSMMWYFYLDKNTTIYVENIPYVLDYDIKIRCVEKKTSDANRYMFTASYVLDDYNNSISDITDPYIKIRRSANGYLALEVKMHQVTRDVQYEQIITNSKINMPTIDINFDGQLVGFDVLYKTPEETDYTTQLQKLLVYSQPIATPFCYYQLYNDNTLRLTFNARDSYFTPKFNSELKVILYLSKGKEANFDIYTGSNITIEQDNSVYNYNNSVVMAAKTLSGSFGGDDRLNLDELQALTIEGYRTALALTTEADLTTFFSNYKYTYGDFYIRFIKRRNDVFERVFGGYCLMQYESEIFKTNTLDIHMNLSDMDNPEDDTIYMIDPGTVFTYSNEKDNHITFYRNKEQYESNYNEYQDAITTGSFTDLNGNTRSIKYVEDESDPNIPEYLKSRNISFAEFKARKYGTDDAYNDKYHINDKNKEEWTEIESGKNFLFINPFLIRFIKSPNLVTLYQTYINETSTVDFTNKNDDSFVQFIAYQVHIKRDFNESKEYTVTTAIMPSITLDNENPVICPKKDETGKIIGYSLNDRSTLKDNDLRVLFVIYDDETPICYSEMVPTSFTDGTNLKYETKFSSDDHITSLNKLRLTAGDSLVPLNNDDSGIYIPMENVKCKIFTLYRKKYVTNEDGETKLLPTNESDTNNIFYRNEEPYNTYNTYIWTNEYTTDMEPLTFIKQLNHVRSSLYFEDYTEKDADGNYKYDIMDVRMESLPFLKWDMSFSEDKMSIFMSVFTAQYENINNIITSRLRNETSIDFKFYNTYGRSMNYYIGDDYELLNTLNLKVSFDMWFVPGTDTLNVVPEIKQFIKTKIETISENGTNQIHISNLMREIEQTYTYVDHIRFKGFNDYDTTYQSIVLKYTDIDEMDKNSRRKYIPELLVIDLDDISITEYTA